MDHGRGNQLPPYLRIPSRPNEVLQRETLGIHASQPKEFGYPMWTPGRGRHPPTAATGVGSAATAGDHFGARNFRNGPPGGFYQEEMDGRYHDEASYLMESPWRSRGRKRRGSIAASLDRPRTRPVYVHPEDQQREAAEVRVRQQLQGITVMKDLCSKESYQRYLKLSNTVPTESPLPADLPDFDDAPDILLDEMETETEEATEAEQVEKVKEMISGLRKMRKGPNYVITQKSSLLLHSEQTDVLRLYYPSS